MLGRVGRRQVADLPLVAQRPLEAAGLRLRRNTSPSPIASGIVRMSENRIAASSAKRASGCSVTSVARSGFGQRQKTAGPRARGVVFGQVASRLPHEPHRRVRRRLAQQRAEERVVLQVRPLRSRRGTCRAVREGSTRSLQEGGPRPPASFTGRAPRQRGNPMSPSGTRPPRARIAGLRGSPTPRATGRAACRPRRTPSAAEVRSEPLPSVSALTLPAGVLRDTELVEQATAPEPTKPIASRTRSAFISNSRAGHLLHRIAVLSISRRTALSAP